MFLNGKIKKKVPFLVLTFTFTFAKLIQSDRRKKVRATIFMHFIAWLKFTHLKRQNLKKKEDAEQGKKTTMRKHYITSCSEREIQ